MFFSAVWLFAVLLVGRLAIQESLSELKENFRSYLVYLIAFGVALVRHSSARRPLHVLLANGIACRYLRLFIWLISVVCQRDGEQSRQC